MTCEVCQTENATVHLTQIISGKMQKIDLCEKCAKEKGVADPAGLAPAISAAARCTAATMRG